MFTTERRTCGDKKQYESKREAQGTVSYLIREQGARPDSFAIYCCDYCGWFHIGHKRTIRRGVKSSWSTA